MIEDEIRKYVESKKNLLVTADQVIDYWRAKNWLTNKNKLITSASNAVSVVNGLKHEGYSITPSYVKKKNDKKLLTDALKNGVGEMLVRAKVLKTKNRKYIVGTKKKDKEKIIEVERDIINKRPELIKKRTKYEKNIEDWFKLYSITYKVQVPIVVRYRKKCYVSYPDFLINDNVIVEIDGGYHNETNAKQWDNIKEKSWKKQGYKVIRFTNEQIADEKYLSSVLLKNKMYI